MPAPVNISVIYYSSTGNVAAMARAVGEGAAEEGAEVRVLRVPEIAPPEVIATNPRWEAYVAATRDEPTASVDDLDWADGFALGSPTRFGGPAAQLKQVLDQTGGLWFQDKLSSKVGTSFTSASTAHGGLESTILAMNNVLYHWGTIVLPLGYSAEIVKETGNPYGASWVSRRSAPPDDNALEACRAQGRRLAVVTAGVKAALAPGDG